MSTFTAHVSRKHSDCSEVNLIDSVALPHGMNECTEQHLEMSQDFLCSDTDGVEQDSLQEIHEISHSHLPFKLREKFRALEFSEADINAIF